MPGLLIRAKFVYQRKVLFSKLFKVEMYCATVSVSGYDSVCYTNGMMYKTDAIKFMGTSRAFVMFCGSLPVSDREL